MDVTYDDFPAIVLSNGVIEATILLVGTSLVSLVLADDEPRLNPLWNPRRIAAGRPHPFGNGPGFGHFVCVDGFGMPSPEERQAGLPMHGEAHRRQYEVIESTRSRLQLTATLPLVQESFTRSFRLVDGENVLYVSSELENRMAFDRPVHWAEHATIGWPFLERRATVVDMPAARAKTRAWGPQADLPHRLASFEEFAWPMAPGVDGRPVDLRAAGTEPSGDHTTCLMDAARPLAYITFLHPARRLLLGYVFRRNEFPWVQNWEYYPADDQLARGLEFSTMPFDVPRREAVDMHSLFDTPTYRWLPAKSTITSQFLLFWTRTPPGFARIADVRLAEGTLTVRDAAGATLELSASLGWELSSDRDRRVWQCESGDP
jgi:hypothetical protein